MNTSLNYVKQALINKDKRAKPSTLFVKLNEWLRLVLPIT